MATVESVRSMLRVSRLAIYHEAARAFEELDVETITTMDLAKATGCRRDNILQDLAAFGSFGQPGKGFNTKILRMSLARLLGADRTWQAVIVGSGAKADAVKRSDGFEGLYLNVVGVFDTDSAFVGTTAAGLVVQPMDELASTVQTLGVEVGIIVTPEELAQDVGDLLVLAGVTSVLNVTNRVVRLPAGAHVEQVSLTNGLHRLMYRRLEAGRRPRGESAAGDELHDGGRVTDGARQVGVFEGDAAVEED